jgi:hypothetical protein
MATRTNYALHDDLDGGPADQTVRFSFGGSQYEIDLSAANAAAFRSQLAPFLTHARIARLQRGGAMRTLASRQRSALIRAWAKEQGIAVGDRGRIPATVVGRYEAATAIAR